MTISRGNWRTAAQPSDVVSRVLSLSHTLSTEESSNLGLPDFPVENLPPLVRMMNSAAAGGGGGANVDVYDAVTRLYPYRQVRQGRQCDTGSAIEYKNYFVPMSVIHIGLVTTCRTPCLG